MPLHRQRTRPHLDLMLSTTPACLGANRTGPDCQYVRPTVTPHKFYPCLRTTSHLIADLLSPEAVILGTSKQASPAWYHRLALFFTLDSELSSLSWLCVPVSCSDMRFLVDASRLSHAFRSLYNHLIYTRKFEPLALAVKSLVRSIARTHLGRAPPQSDDFVR